MLRKTLHKLKVIFLFNFVWSKPQKKKLKQKLHHGAYTCDMILGASLAPKYFICFVYWQLVVKSCPTECTKLQPANNQVRVEILSN